MRVASLVKTPNEVALHKVDLGGRGAAIVSVDVTPRDLVTGVVALMAEPELNAGNLELQLTGGTDGETYAVDAVVALNDGSTREVPVELVVIDGDWTMPDGGAPMLSVADFVSRVGRDQVLHLTDMGDGRIDRGLIVAALIDAQAQAEASLAGRYALPFATVPTLVASIIADLARAGLYIDELPDNVAEKRRIALRNLDALRKGDLRLGAEARAQTSAPTDPVRFDPGKRAYPDGLKDYGFQ